MAAPAREVDRWRSRGLQHPRHDGTTEARTTAAPTPATHRSSRSSSRVGSPVISDRPRKKDSPRHRLGLSTSIFSASGSRASTEWMRRNPWRASGRPHRRHRPARLCSATQTEGMKRGVLHDLRAESGVDVPVPRSERRRSRKGPHPCLPARIFSRAAK